MTRFKSRDSVKLVQPFNTSEMTERGLSVGATGVIVASRDKRLGVLWDQCASSFAGMATFNVHDRQWTLCPITEFVVLDETTHDELDGKPVVVTVPDPTPATTKAALAAETAHLSAPELEAYIENARAAHLVGVTQWLTEIYAERFPPVPTPAPPATVKSINPWVNFWRETDRRLKQKRVFYAGNLPASEIKQ